MTANMPDVATGEAGRLRRAAELLRERATAATPGHWYADHIYDTITAEPFRSAREAYDRDYTSDPNDWFSPFVISEGDGGGGANAYDATYIATMSPPVALALADWLGDTAGLIESPEPGLIYDGNAAKIATLILGDRS